MYVTNFLDKKLISAFIVILTVFFTLLAAEGIIRFKNASMKNYDIEMWKYALKLKTLSDNPLLGHEHQLNKSAILQSVMIRTNEYGLRGDPIGSFTPQKRRILFLGSSVTLGWGVSEEKTLTELIKQRFQMNEQVVEVFNAGIGNYNTPRYVERYFTKLQDLKPTDIVVHYVLRDAEELPAARKNLLLRHSQLATTIWIVVSRYVSKFKEPSLEEHYKKVYKEDAKGFLEMQSHLKRLATYCQANEINFYFAMIPDIHDVINYKYHFIHEIMKNMTTQLGYTYVDLLEGLQGFSHKELWAMPGDPHPNALGHERMAKTLFPVLAQG